jgi:low temperature requirement protein LtrA
MTNRAATLRRGPEDPRRATFLDLFYDLAFVFALFQLSHGLLAHLRWSGAFQTAVLLLAVWLVWINTATIGDRYDPARPTIQLVTIGAMFGALVLAIAVPEAFGTRGLVFAGVYTALQVGRNLFLVVITRGAGGGSVRGSCSGLACQRCRGWRALPLRAGRAGRCGRWR